MLKISTPHALDILDVNGQMQHLEPTHLALRIASRSTPAGEVYGLPLAKLELGGILNLQALDIQEGDVVVVSLIVANLLKNQLENHILSLPKNVKICCPGGSIRSNGSISGCVGLSVIAFSPER